MPRSNSVSDIWYIDREDRIVAIQNKLDGMKNMSNMPRQEGKEGAHQAAYWGDAGWWNANRYSMNEEGGYAVVNVNDELFDMPSFWYGTDYRSLAKAIEELSENKKCGFIILNINSPGGMMSGLFEFCEVIRTCGKPVFAYVGNWACSAAYAIACSCKKIYATPTSEVGSVGAIYHILDWSKYYEQIGLEEITITAQHSENKHLDVRSEKGRKKLQERINKAEEFLINHIAKTRGVTPDDVLAKYGHGDVFYSDEALSRGMVDELVSGLDQCVDRIKNPSSATAATTVEASAETGTERGELKMEKATTIEELKTQYPDLCAKLEAEASAKAKEGEDARVQAAVDAELERRNAILAYNTVDDPDFKAFVDKAVNEKMSVADFAQKAAPMLLALSSKAKPAAQAETPEEEDGDDFLKEEAEGSAKAVVRTQGKAEAEINNPDAYFKNEADKLSFDEEN